MHKLRWEKRFKNWGDRDLIRYGQNDKHIENQLRERVIDRNNKGEVRLRFADESPWNENKEKELITNIESMKADEKRKEERYKEKLILDDLKGVILMNEALVEKGILVQIQEGREDAIWKALEQIHNNSLDQGDVEKKGVCNEGNQRNVRDEKGGRVGEEKEKVDEDGEWKTVSYSRKRNIKGSTIYVVGIADKALAKDIWKVFCEVGNVKDIVLPKKRDRFGNRIGFVKTSNLETGRKLIERFDGVTLWGKKISPTIARSKNGVGSKYGTNKKVDQGGQHKEEMHSHAVQMYEKEHESLQPNVCKDETGTENLKSCFLNTDEELLKLLDRSMIGQTWEMEEEDILVEKIVSIGFLNLEVRKISNKKFLLSCENLEQKNGMD